MGNSPSNVNSDSDEEEGYALQDMKVLNGTINELDSCFDLGVLFDHKLLREATSKIKEEAAASILQQYHGHLVRWVEERRSRSEETITLSQFADMLVLHGADREDAVELFNQFDAEGEGIIDRETLQTAITSSSSGIGQKGELRAVLQTFRNCSICPGMIDAFVANKHSISDHGKRLLKVILRSRASSASIATPVVEGFCNTAEMRLKVLHAHLQTIKEKANLKKTEPPCEAGEFLRPLTKCFSSTETSSNKAESFRLTNGDPNTYWQSDGPARSHWIRLRMRSNVVIKELSFQVASADQSYMPQRVVVSGGRDEINLRELNDVRIPSHVTGSVVLLENVKMPYPVIQINIRRCHSDGCDTRIHGINAIGYRVVKSKGVSVADATAVWYLSVLTSTATLTMPMAPQLRTQIINHTREALGHMVPLSLCPTSPVRPAFLSTSVLDEMERFLYFIASYDNNLDSEGMQVLIEFSLARGNLGGIFNVLKLLYDNLDLKFTAKNVLRSLVDEQERAVQKHGGKLNVSFVGCNGGEKDANSLPKNVLSENWSTEAYYSETGKVNLSMAFSSERTTIVQLTKITLKVCKGGTGPRSGLIFMHNQVQISNGELDVKHLDKYNTWNSTIYQEYLKRGNEMKRKFASSSRSPESENTERRQPDEDEPVAFFTMDSEWDEVDIPLDKPSVGKFIIIKFMGARDENAERLGILGIQFYGYEKTLDEIQDSDNWKNLTSIAENETISGSVLFLQVLLFLDCMAKDLKNCAKKKKDSEMSEKEPCLDMSKMSLKHLWDVYSAVIDRDEENKSIASTLILRLFYQALPYLRHDIQGKTEDDSKELSTRVFKHLCEVVDDTEGKYNKKLVQTTKDIILDGTEVFFPDADTRRGHLLSMVDEVMEERKLQSLALTFESLCKFFSNKDASGLLGLPNSLPQGGFDSHSVLSVMSTLVSVAYQEWQSSLQSDYDQNEERKTSNLVQLLSAMQKSLLTWCSSQIGTGNEGKHVAVEVVIKYTLLIAEKTYLALEAIDYCKTKDEAVAVLEHSFVAYTFRQMILFLSTFAPIEEIVLPVLKNLQRVSTEIKRIAEDLPRYFMETCSSEQMKKSGRVILRTWEMESSHNYENNQNFTKVFSCPGCSEFFVQFDSRCETERRYDYLEFTDSNGVKKRFDQKVGTEKWPVEVIFASGNKLQFLFHSDGSNNEWGYKFKVTARGCPDITLSWLFDLQLGLASLFGLFCSSVMAGYPKGGKKGEKKKVDGDAALLQSKIWTTLFRGSCTNKGKLQRSLSGHHATTFSEDNNVHTFCKGLATETEGKRYDLVKRCQAACGQPSIGGKNVEEAVRCVFAALVWHSQRLRDELTLFVTDCPPEDIPTGISDAYKTAESLRRNLVEARQKLVLEAEQGKEKNGKTVVPDDIITSCKEKAWFLLNFAGLTGILASSSDLKERQGSSLTSKNSTFNRISIHSRRQNKLPGENTKVLDKYPSFQLVLDFVTNNDFSHSRVEDLLEERTKFAHDLAEIYFFAAEYVRMFSKPHIFQAPVVIFLQQMLVHQKTFPSHYGDNLDGCGLELEGKVRKTYYTFLRRLLDSIRSFTGDPNDESPCSVAFSCIRAYLLHFLDIEWKSYDLAFLNEINLPEFLLTTTKGTVSALQQKSTEISDKRELEEYKENMAWKDEATKGFHAWWEGMQSSVTNPEEKRKLHLFLSRFAELFDVDVFCDGCKIALSGRRFRCLNCLEIDLCVSCYSGDVKPSGHTGVHEVAELRWKCDNCNGFIIGTRFHCNDCDNFDLCLGCQTANTWPEGHLITHSMTKYPKKTDILLPQRIPAYTHTHAWYQFAVLSLTLANALNDPVTNDTYGDYLVITDTLHGKCLSLITKCLNEALKTAEVEAREEKKRIEALDQLSRSDATKVEPGTSEGTFLGKSSEEKSEISETKDILKGAESKNAAEKVAGETVVENSEKDKSVDSEFGASDQSKQPPLVPNEGTNDRLQTEKKNVLDSDELRKPNDLTEKISKDIPSVEGASNDSSFDLTSAGVKVQSLSSTKQRTGTTNESIIAEDCETRKSKSETADVSSNTTETAISGESASAVSTSKVDEAPNTCDPNEKGKCEDKETEGQKADIETNETDERTESIAKAESVGEQTNEMDTLSAKHQGFSPKFPQSNYPVPPQRKKLTPEQLESLFVRETQEKVLGLIGAMLPKDSKLSHWTTVRRSGREDFLITEFLPILFKIVRSPDVLFEFRNMTIGVLGKFLQCIQTEACDRGISIIQNDVGEDETSDADAIHGRLTVKCLFQFGAEYLARSDLESASSVACCLQQLCQCSQWQSSITFQITQCLASLAKNSDNPRLDGIFGVLVFAGFPNVLQMGSIVEVNEPGNEQKEVIALSYNTTKASAIVIDIKSRKRKTVKESDLHEHPFLMELHCASEFSTLLTIARDILKALKNPDDNMSVERLWILYLVLKSILSNLKGSKCEDLRNKILDDDLMPLLVYLACQATDLSRMWLLRDLEILSVKLYKKQLDGGKNVPKLMKPVETEESQVSVPGPETSFLQTFQDAIQAPLALLESLFDRDGQARILEEVQRSLHEGNLRRIQNQSSAKEKEIPETPDDNSVDIGVVRYLLGELQPKTFKAKEEDQNTCQKLMPSFTEEEIAENQRAQARLKSGNLLRSELTKDNPADFMKKINKALCIMYARHVLSRLLADWPDGRTLTSEILNSGDEVQLIGILDLLQRIERKKVFETVVTSVVKNGDPLLIKPLSLAAAHCMGEVKLSSETKETEHPYKNNVTEEGKVHIPGAASLSIKFDPKCSSEENCDELIMATSSNYTEHRHEFSGQSGWIDFELPGDTLYFSFQSDSTNTDWGWKFTVTGGQLGRFETGYTILKALLVPDLDLARSLPLRNLWAWLVSVACSQTGQQRLMATGLLLRVLLVSSKLPSDERPDLNLLNSLWALYTDMLEKETGGLPPTLVPPALRGLTELFLVVENLAQDWGITEELIVGLTTEEALRRCFTQAVWNVGAIGAAINMPNKATEAVKKALATSSTQETKKSGKSVVKSTPRNSSRTRLIPHCSDPRPLTSESSDMDSDSFMSDDGSSGSDN